MATIKDIAQEAGVSVMTVSNVIRGAKSHVSKETAEKINALIEKYHYTPNMAARTLVTKNSHIIGLLNHAESRDISMVHEDPFFGLIIRSIEQTLSLRQYYLMTKTVITVKELSDIKQNWNLAGMIVYGVFEGEFFNQLAKCGIPCTFIDSYIEDNPFYNVGLEDYKGAYKATSYLVSKGHRSIAFVSPIIYDNGVVHERFLGYKDALEDAGIAFREENVYQVSSLDAGLMMGEKLSLRTDITAIFATADLLALGIMSGLQEKGVRIPQDKSIIGFDDLFESTLFNPPLTTIRQDVRKKGEAAVNNLLDVIEGKEVPRNTVFPIELIERKSVAAVQTH